MGILQTDNFIITAIIIKEAINYERSNVSYSKKVSGDDSVSEDFIIKFWLF